MASASLALLSGTKFVPATPAWKLLSTNSIICSLPVRFTRYSPPRYSQKISSVNSVRRIEIVPGASHLFEEPGTLEEVARLASNWFTEYLR